MAAPRIVTAKLERPTVPTVDARPDLVATVPASARYVAIVAPPGYGKTFLASELHANCPPGSAAWLSVDLLDRQPYAFWTHLIEALRGTAAPIDDEPAELLAERPTSDFTFLAALAQQLRSSPAPVLLVLDDVDQIHDPDVLAGLDRLAEWADGHLRLVLTGRLDPSLPLTDWRARGLLAEFRQDDLRFDASAARRFLESTVPGLLDPEEIEALQTRTEGWPMALQIASIVARESGDPGRAVREMVSTGRLLSDYVTREVLDALPSAHRDVALGLSVLDWFDHDLCAEVLGLAAVPVVRELQQRGLPLTQLADREGFRWHSLVRELLESELAWRQPERRIELHASVGEALLRRGDRVAAVRHLVAADDLERAGAVMAEPALTLVDGGRTDELRMALAQLPDDADVGGPEREIDIALAQLITGRRRELERWVDRARVSTPADDAGLRYRFQVLEIGHRAALGHADEAQQLVERQGPGTRSSDSWQWDARRAPIVIRAIHSLQLGGLEEWLAELRASSAPAIVRDVLAPAIESLVALEGGDLVAARQRSSESEGHLDLVSSDHHPVMFDALLAAGWCAWAVGSFDRAHELADRLLVHPFASFPMMRIRVVALLADVAVRTGRADAALALLSEIDPADLEGGAVRAVHDLALARGLHAAQRHDEVARVLARCDRSSAGDLLLAWSAARRGDAEEARRRIVRSAGWPTQLRIEATLVESCLVAEPEQTSLVAAAVAEAARDGWVAPLLGHGADLDHAVRSAAAGVHPTLAAALQPVAVERDPVQSSGPTVHLTEREQTLLELLPTHLSYGQMGERLFVSVNTIKSNLKSVYRKLGAGTRDEAIRAARETGLLPDGR